MNLAAFLANPKVIKAIASGLARGGMFYVGGTGVGDATGVNLGDYEAIVNQLLVVIPAIWTVVNKLRVDRRIQKAKDTGK